MRDPGVAGDAAVAQFLFIFEGNGREIERQVGERTRGSLPPILRVFLAREKLLASVWIAKKPAVPPPTQCAAGPPPAN
jgi:hypothetical protein